MLRMFFAHVSAHSLSSTIIAHNLSSNVRVNDLLVYPGARVALPHLSLVSVVNVHLLFMVNFCATSRLTERTNKLVQMV